jgi:hypothetical protein
MLFPMKIHMQNTKKMKMKFAKFGQSFHFIFFVNFIWSGVIYQCGFVLGNNLWKENDIISLEIDTNKKLVHLFINNILQPVSLSNIPFPLKIAVCLKIICYFFSSFIFIFRVIALNLFHLGIFPFLP